MKKLLFIITLLLAFALTGCKKKKNNGLTKEDEDYSFVDDFIAGFSEDNARNAVFVYYEDDTFTTDSSDSTYEIGYMFDVDLKFNLRMIDDYEPGLVIRGKYALTHHKVRRNKETKEIDSTYKPFFLDETGNTYQIYTEYTQETGSKIIKETCTPETTDTNKFTTTITRDEFMSLIPCTVYEVPFKKISRAVDTENTSTVEMYVYTYDVAELNKKITFKEKDAAINGFHDMVVVMKDGRELPVISFATTIKFDYV